MLSSIQPTALFSAPRPPAAESEAEQKAVAAQDELSAEQERELQKLKARDREVRAHEQAHMAAAGSLAQGGPSYTYERGPDSQLYAVGGEVQIDTSEVSGDPAATIQKAQIIRRAALAPASPSSQDRTVAAQASQMAAEARAELAAERSDNTEKTATEDVSGSCPACGGAHSSEAHEGITAYAANAAPPSQPSLVAAV